MALKDMDKIKEFLEKKKNTVKFVPGQRRNNLGIIEQNNRTLGNDCERTNKINT